MPTSAIAQIVQKLSPRLYIDFIRYLPAEICLNILGYLDPLSLISVARSCRAWYGLALDRKLWERLYYLEGWKTIASELQKWEETINRDRPMPFDEEDGGHLSKRRAIASSRRAADGDRDHVMLDADRPWKSDMTAVDSLPEGESASSLFGNKEKELDPSAVTSFSSVSTATSSSSKKGKQRASSPPPPGPAAATGAADSLTPVREASPEGLPKPSLWVLDSASGKYRMNWKHLYTLRRRLEANWELGKYTNFQFPHPDHPKEAHGECIYTIQFNADYLVSGSRDRTIRIWNLQTRRLARMPFVGHRGSVLCLQFDSDPDEDLIVSGSSDSNVILWRFSTGEIIQRLHRAHREPVLNVKFDKNILVTCSKDKTIKIFNRRPLQPGDLGYDVDSNNNNKQAAPVNPVPIHLKRYGYDDDSLSHLPLKPAYTMIGSLEGHSAAVNAVQIHGREIISASGDRNVKIWDWPNQQCIRTLVGHSKGIACVQYDGRRIVSGSSDNEVKVFDRRTSLEVGSLRSHSNLVRTVQAGFGDLPYSAEEDEKAAARMDQRYLEAVQNGTLPVNPTNQRRHIRSRIRGTGAAAADSNDDDDNGTLRPENIRFTGAKLPPGGGGGQYGRIVSGSYDTTIIIWRRNKHGMWKPQHHLKQEEAAAAAAAAAASSATNALRIARRQAAAAAAVAGELGSQPLTQAALGALQQQAAAAQSAHHAAAAPASAVAAGQVPVPSTTTATPQPSSHAMHVDLPDAGGSSSAAAAAASIPAPAPAHPQLARLIDDLIAQGVHALQQALSTYPDLLQMQPTLQAAIDRHPSPFVRSQLRQAVSTALVRAQMAQAQSGGGAGGSRHATLAAGPLPPPAGHASSAAVAAQPQGGASAGASTEGSVPAPPAATPAGAAEPWTGGASTSLPPATAIAPHTVTLAALENHHQQQVVLPPPALPAIAGTNTMPPAAPHAAAAAATGPPPHHPHMHAAAAAAAAADDQANPARVFKLQFDARRIICCSQTPIIVGWDFCNGDPELEEAARFFGTIE